MIRPLLSFSRAAAALLLISTALAADIRSFGARGDGVADDTAALQKAVDAGGSVQFSSGTYRVTRTIAIDLAKTGFVALTADGTARVIMSGAGPAFQFTGTITGSAAPGSIKPPVWERERSPRVDGLEIVGAHTEADGLAANGTMQLTITRVLIREARHGIRLHGRNRNVLISDCHVYHNRGIGVYFDDVDLHQTNITGSHISYNAGGGIVTRAGNVRNLHIGNCDIESNMQPDTPPTANILIDSTGGSTGEVTITSCTIQHNPVSPGSANIRIIGAGFRTPTNHEPTNEGQIAITGNMMNDVHVNIHLQSVRGVAISGNSLGMAMAHDILIEDSRNVALGANTIDRNPRYSGAGPRHGGVAFRRSHDCTITGLQVMNVLKQPAAVLLESCRRFNVTGVSILDSDGAGLELRDTTLTRVSNCLIRDDRPAANPAPSLVVTGGGRNTITDNSLDRAPQIAAGTAALRDNEVLAR